MLLGCSHPAELETVLTGACKVLGKVRDNYIGHKSSRMVVQAQLGKPHRVQQAAQGSRETQCDTKYFPGGAWQL